MELALRKPATSEILKWDGDTQAEWVEEFCAKTEKYLDRVMTVIEARQLIGQLSTMTHALREANAARELQRRAQVTVMWAERQLGVAAKAERVLTRPDGITPKRWEAAQRFAAATVQHFDQAIRKCATASRLNRQSVTRVLDGLEPEKAQPRDPSPQERVDELVRLVAWAAGIAEDDDLDDDALRYIDVKSGGVPGLQYDLEVLQRFVDRLAASQP